MSTRVVSLAAFLLLLGVSAILSTGCDQKRSIDTPRTHLPPTELGARVVTFSGWDEFLSANPGPPGQHVVFIGIDGATWDIIDPLLEKGLLPTLRRLKLEGSYGTLRSVDCYVSPPAWTSMMTGYSPERTGIYTFGHWQRAKQEFLDLQSSDIRVPLIWQAASFAGRRTAIVNVPLTYPTQPVNGLMVSGMLTPSALAPVRTLQLAFRATDEGTETSDTLRATFDHGESRFDATLVGTPGHDGAVSERIRLEVSARQNPKGRSVYTFSPREYSPWLAVEVKRNGVIREGRCRIQFLPIDPAGRNYLVITSPTLFFAGDTEVPFAFPDTLAGVLSDAFDHYFPSTFLPAELVSPFTEDGARYANFFYDRDEWDLFAHVFTQTDNIQHLEGNSPRAREVYETIDRFLGALVDRLPENTTLVIASDHGFHRYEYGIDLNRWLQEIGLLHYADGASIDFENTAVFHNLWGVYFNVPLLDSELKKRGITLGELSTAEATARFLNEAGAEIGDGQNRFPVNFMPVGKKRADGAPDLYVQGTYENYQIEFWNLDRPRQSIVRRLAPDEQWNHDRNGIYILYGPGIKPGRHAPQSEIYDVGATMLYLLGLPLADDMDGILMTDALSEEFLRARPVYYVSGYDKLPRAETTLIEKRQALEKRLRSLGYIR